MNEWAEKNGVVEYDMEVSSVYSPVETLPGGVLQRTLVVTCAVNYYGAKEPAAADESKDEFAVNEPPLPLSPEARAPTVEVVMLQGGRRCKAYAMAGIFGVPEGMKLHPDDEKPAPTPVFSPDLDLKTLADYFGNVRPGG